MDAERFRLFFGTKTKTQWLDPWFGAITMCYNPEVDTPVFPATLLCRGALQGPAQSLLLALMTTVYLAAAAGVAVAARKHRGAVWAQLPAIVFLGGFLFQFVWESKSRYCFPYFMLLLPLAAAALAAAADKLPKATPHNSRRTA